MTGRDDSMARHPACKGRDLTTEGPVPGQAGVCPECAPTYCAPQRCYCGHPECPAYATFVPRLRAVS